MAEKEEPEYHNLSEQEIVKVLGSNLEKGLTTHEANERHLK
jgi:hypothetical protein